MPSRGPLWPWRIGRRRRLMLGLCVIVGASLGIPASTMAGPAPMPDDRVAAAFEQEAPAGEPIPITPLSSLSSLDAAITLQVDGTVAGRPTSGDLTAQLHTDDRPSSRIDATGSLLGDVVAQVGGSAVKLFRPRKVSVYNVPDGTYAVVSGLFDVCIRTDSPDATAVLDQLSPQSLMTMLTGSDVARGTLVGEETLDGLPVRHYIIDGPGFLSAAQASSDPNVSRFASDLRSAADADLYVAADSGLPVAYRGAFSGAFEPLEFDGELAVQIDLTGIDTEDPVELPGACDYPIST